uniref:BTB domain-containing protein n=1 Tax=Plectus sambesii TaxID=2011161 RepID=A0A914V4N1_9BILA
MLFESEVSYVAAENRSIDEQRPYVVLTPAQSFPPSSGGRSRKPRRRSSNTAVMPSLRTDGDDGTDKTLLEIGDDRTPDTLPLSFPRISCGGMQQSFDIVTINVAGLRFQTCLETLERFPDTLLGHPVKRQRHYNPHTGEYFFDRHRACFESILYIYQSDGQVKRAESVPIDIFIRELKFFEMGDDVLERFWISEGYEKPEEAPMPKTPWMRTIWELMEYPDSSVYARIMAFVSVFVIVISILFFCLETIPELKPDYNSTHTWEGEKIQKMDFSNAFFLVELGCISWFTIEFLLRFISSPSKAKFAKSFLNIIDFVAIAPFFVNLIWSDAGGSAMSFAVLRVLRLVRVFRIFKLSRHSVGLQILGKTFRASVQEFILLIFFMAIAMVLFASGVYFAEQGDPDTKFSSIPASFWYVIVTMTTVGYGDLVPIGVYGKIVGAMCSLIGVLTLALPVPIIVANFKHFYRQEARLASMTNTEEGETADNDSSSS